VPNLRVAFGRARRNVGSPTPMRGPGAVPGLYATESAMNELADQLKIDPVRLRVLNEPKIDESLGIPFSSRHLLECFELGSEKTGVPLDKIEVALGDTSLPEGPTSGGSMVTGSMVPAVFEAADKAIESLLTIATTAPGSPFEKRKPADLAFEGGRVFVKADGPSGGVSFADVLRRANVRLVTGSGKSEATFGNPKPKF